MITSGLHRGHTPYGGQCAAHSPPPHAHHPHPQMVRRRVGIASVDESVWASLFTSSADRTYLDTGTVSPQWSVTLASTRRGGSSVVLSSDVCDASAPTPTPTQASPRDKPKKDNKRPRQGDPLDAHRAGPPQWDPRSAAVVVARPC